MKINKMLIAVLAMLAVVLSSCKDDDPTVGIDSGMPAPFDFVYDEMGSSNTAISVSWNAEQAIAAGATSFTVQLIKSVDAVGDVYDNDIKKGGMSTTIDASANPHDLCTFNGLKAGRIYYVRVRANYPRSVYSDWVLASAAGAPARIKVGKGIVPESEGPDAALMVRMGTISESTAIVEWSTTSFADNDADKKNAYTLEIFEDAALSKLNVKWTYGANNSIWAGGTKFILTGLTPGTKYWARVTDTTNDEVAETLEFQTNASQAKAIPATAAAGDIILYEDFRDLLWGGDLFYSAAGYSATARSSATEFWKATGSDPLNSVPEAGFYLVDRSVEMGMFNTVGKALPATSLKDWGLMAEDNTAGAICARPGQVKMGASSKCAWICTPELSCLTKPATIELTFKAALYGTDPGQAIIEVLDKTTKAANFFITYEDRFVAEEFSVESPWKEYKFTISNVTNTSRIAIGGNRKGVAGQHRFYLDDIQIKVISYGELTAPDAPAKPELTPTDKTIIVTWDKVSRADGYTVEYKKTADANWTVAIAKTAETTYTIEGLDFETAYDVRVKALTGDMASEPSEVAQTTTLAEIKQLATPQNVTAEADYGIATLTFDPVVGATDYEVYANGAAEKLVGMITANAEKVTYKVTGLSFNTAYTFQVKAVADGITPSELSTATESATTSTIVQVKNNVGPTTATVAWRKNLGKYETKQDPVDQYTIQIADNSGTVMGTIDLKTTNFGATASTIAKHEQGTYNPSRFTFGALEPATTYKVRVKKLGEDDLLYSPWCEITTESAHVAAAKEVLYQGFDEAWYGGDVMNLAGGVQPTGDNTKTPVMTWESYIGNTATNRLAEDTNTTQSTFAGAICKLESSSLYGWEVPQRIAFRPGYVKFGGGSEPGILITPALGENVLNATTATPCTISFKAAPYSEWSSSTDTTCEAMISVIVVHADGSETVAIENFDPITNGDPWNYIWKEGSVKGVNLLSTDKLKITSKNIGSNKCRFMFDDLLVVAE